MVKILCGFVFVLLRIYADLIRFQSRVKDLLHITILVKSIILFFIHCFNVLTFIYEKEKSNNM